MATGEVLGQIDCPVCGHDRGMRIAADKNGEPFGFCEANCDAQMRVGGKLRRVELFYRHHPGIRRPGGTVQPIQVASAVPGAASHEDAPATVTEQKPDIITKLHICNLCQLHIAHYSPLSYKKKEAAQILLSSSCLKSCGCRLPHSTV